jgi:hypothetical protein
MDVIFAGHSIFDNWLLDLPGGSGSPQIQFTAVPAKGSNDDLKGRVLHIDPSKYAVAVYIYGSGGWWTKPFYERPKTWINADGTFSADITTDIRDQYATQIRAFLVPREYELPLATGKELPSSVQRDAVASNAVNR